MRRCIGFVLFIGSLLCGQPRIDTSRADAIAAAQHKQQKVAGLAVGVVTRDGAYRQGYGVRSLDSSFQGRPYGHRSAPPACRAVRDRRIGRGDAWGPSGYRKRSDGSVFSTTAGARRSETLSGSGAEGGAGLWPAESPRHLGG